eukprot:1190458-Prorocentrum_minimum.AAC.3
MRCETRCLKPDHAASRTKRTARSQRIKFMHRPRAHVRSKKARHGCRNSPSPQFDMCTSRPRATFRACCLTLPVFLEIARFHAGSWRCRGLRIPRTGPGNKFSSCGNRKESKLILVSAAEEQSGNQQKRDNKSTNFSRLHTVHDVVYTGKHCDEKHNDDI